MPRFRKLLVLLQSTAVACVLAAGTATAQETSLLSQDGRAVRALLIGIDAYQKVRPLKGASADARDIDSALRKKGVTDIVTLIDSDATRERVLQEINGMTKRINPGDLVVLSIAGHGAQEPERVKGSQPDGMDNIFLLPGFDTSGAGTKQRIIGSEFNHFIKQFEAKGARVLFVADTCHGGGMTREIDPRAEEMSFRQVSRYVLTIDELKPVATTADSYLTELDFQETAFLAAVDRKTKAPEVKIPGTPGYRGALSYAVARSFEGEADANHDGKTTLEELFTQVRGVVYQLSDQRQNPVTAASPNRNIEQDLAFTLASRPAKGGIIITDAEPDPQPKKPATSVIRLASLGAPNAALSKLEQREAPFQVVKAADGADLIWDPNTRDVLSQGDVIAYQVDASDLPSVVDRSAAVQGIKQLAAKAPQAIKVSPDDKLHHNDKKVTVDIMGVGGRALILFNLASDGTVQLLYPVKSDAPVVASPNYRLPVVVRSPFGADQIVAITSEQRMVALEKAVQGLDMRRTAMQMMRMVERYAPKDARIGTIGIFTAP